MKIWLMSSKSPDSAGMPECVFPRPGDAVLVGTKPAAAPGGSGLGPSFGVFCGVCDLELQAEGPKVMGPRPEEPGGPQFRAFARGGVLPRNTAGASFEEFDKELLPESVERSRARAPCTAPPPPHSTPAAGVAAAAGRSPPAELGLETPPEESP